MFGYDGPEEIIDKLGPMDLTAPESRELVQTNIERRLSGEIDEIRYTFKGLRKDGTTFDVEAHGSRALHARRPAVISTIMDITRTRTVAPPTRGAVEGGTRPFPRTLTPMKPCTELWRSRPPSSQATLPTSSSSASTNSNSSSRQVIGKSTPTCARLIDNGVDIESLATYQHMLATHAPILIADTANSPLWMSANEGVDNPRLSRRTTDCAR